MKKIQYICDRCRQDIEDDPRKIFVESVNRSNGDFADTDPYPDLKEFDFCKNCGDYCAELIRRCCKKGVPAVSNKEFEKAVQEMVSSAGEVADPPPGGEDQTQARYRENRCAEEGRVGSESNCRGNELFRSSSLQCSEKEESSGA